MKKTSILGFSVIFLFVALAAGFASIGCSGDKSDEVITKPMVPDPNMRDEDVDWSEYDYEEETPEAPADPVLPDCLTKDSPTGCAELPTITDWECPEGFSPAPIFIDEAGVPNTPEGMTAATLCLPPNPPETCPEGKMPVLGEAECQLIGDPCPEGDFPIVPNDVPGDRIYVKAGVSQGDGTEDQPYGSLTEALEGAQSGGVLLIGKGTYEESIEVTKSLTLWGACVTETSISAPGPHAGGNGGAIIPRGDIELSVRNLHITGEQNGIRILDADTRFIGAGLWIHDTVRYGMLVEYGQVDLADTYISDIRMEDTALRGRGLFVDYGAQVILNRVSIERVFSSGLQVYGLTDPPLKSKLEARRILIRDVKSDGNQTFGRGLQVTDNCDILVEGCLIEKTRDMAFLAAVNPDETAPEIRLSDLIIRNTLMVEDFDYSQVDTEAVGVRGTGIGLNIQDIVDTPAQIERVLIEGSKTHGLSILESKAEIRDLVIRDTTGLEQTATYGRGMEISSSSSAVLERVVIDRSRSYGSFFGCETTAEIEHLVIRDGLGESEGRDGSGLNVGCGAEVRLKKGLIESNRAFGIGMLGTEDNQPVQLTMEDVIIRNTKVDRQGRGGRGMDLAGNVHLEAERLTLDANLEVGIFIASKRGADDTRADISQLLIRNTKANPAMVGGRAMAIQDDAVVSISEGLLVGNQEAGIVLALANSSKSPPSLTLTDVVIEDVHGRYSSSDGRGINVQSGSQVEALRLRIVNARESSIIVLSSDIGGQTRFKGQDISIINTQVAECGEIAEGEIGSCILDGKNHGSGNGISLIRDSIGELERFLIRGSVLNGLLLARGGGITLSTGQITENSIGINNMNPGGLGLTATSSVYCYQNQVNYERWEMPVPNPMDLMDMN